jgi:hypothetical protein
MVRLSALLLALVVVLAARASAHDPITTKVTWSREISHIVERRCAGCHRTDGVAPMPLTTYEQARPWLKAIKAEVVARRMPKWPAARGIGEFDNDRSLSPFEIELIAAWVDGGAPKGDARPMPAAQPASGSIRIDEQLRLPARQTPPAGEKRTVSVTTSDRSDRWITGWRFRPNDAAILQAEIRLQRGPLLGTWVPPEDAMPLPRDAGIALPAHAVVDVTLWYRSAQMQQDFPIGLPSRGPELGLSLVSTPPAREVREIEAACGTTTFTDTGEIFAVRPLTDRPKAPIGVAVRPADGPPLALAWLRESDPQYQPTYRLRTAVAIQANAHIEVASDDPSCRAFVQYVRQSRPTSTTNGIVITSPRR